VIRAPRFCVCASVLPLQYLRRVAQVRAAMMSRDQLYRNRAAMLIPFTFACAGALR